jgi:hypothetical protein
MSYQVFVGDIETSQYANLYEQNLAPFVSTYYNLQVDVDLNVLFSTHNFQQTAETDPANADLVNVRLSMNRDKVNELLGLSDIASPGSVKPLTTGASGTSGGKNNGSIDGALTSGTDNIATRLLEIVAIHIFGHGRARAAIRNDSEYATSMSHIRNQVALLFTQDVANDFFNQYVNMNKIMNMNDVNENQPFNFDGIELGYRVNFVLTNILDSDGANSTLISNWEANGAGWNTNILLKFVHTP